MSENKSIGKGIIISLSICYSLLILFTLGLVYFVFKQVPFTVLGLIAACLLMVPYYILVGFGKGATYVPIGPILGKLFKRSKRKI
jgi:hypothetical protein